jgi:Polyketide cyclase / dehydrase and lipid transport
MFIALYVIAGVIIVFCVLVALQSSDFRIERSATFAAPPPAAFAQVNDFHKWEAWSPWAKMDPACKNEFSGSPAGEGAIFSWAGNKKVGEGRMTILQSRPFEFIRIRLEFFKPFAATNTAEFTFAAGGNQTTVSWAMFGRQKFMNKAFCMFMNMDKMVGGQFEQGLAQMKLLAEAESKA